VAGLLLGLAFLLFPAWERTLPQPAGGPRSSSYRQDVIGQLVSASMLAALGFLLAMRQGAIDLSIWAMMGLGGLLAAWMINAGHVPWVAFLVAVAIGAVVGGVNAFFVAGLKLPSPLITLATGIGMVAVAGQLVGAREVMLRPDAFDGWVRGIQALLDAKQPSAPLQTARMILVAGAWSVVLVVLLWRYHLTLSVNEDARRRRPALLAALVASAALASLAGACWLLDHGRAPVPTRPVDGLVIPTAAVLAGAVVLVGRGRTILACICLPVAVLMVKLWRQVAPPVRNGGFDAAVGILAVMVVGLQLAGIWALSRRRGGRAWRPLATTVVMLIGLGVAGWSLRYGGPAAWRGMKAGLGIWGLGAAASVATVCRAAILRRRQSG
jgi:ribose/xylose/arabinose/galactoside ABC-type transport system permease subunit